MIIILKSGATDAQIDHVIERVESLGLRAHLSRGTHRTIIGVIGDESQFEPAQFQVLPGVTEVIRVLPAYKLASNEAHPEPSVVDIAGVKVGGGNLAMIAGPCAIEGAQRLDAIAAQVRAAGANILRGGAFKPRTSPYAYQGMGEEGLKILRDVGQKHGMPVVTEVMDPRRVEMVERYADMIQIGARNMQNFVLLTEVGSTKKPVLLKRGMSATIVDLLMSAEYILSQGNPNVVLCERGVKGFDSIARNLFDVAAVPACKALSHLPIIVDPSHATGRPDLIGPCALAGIAAGADGVHIEVHNCPEEAMSDGPQALLPPAYEELAGQIRQLAALFGKSISSPPASKR
ncbi:MAG TPA: 3-deoxy-7-phosphoheptulonate synthase [Pirellulales bacterium]